MSNGLNPDQDRRFVGPDPGPNCLQRLSAAYASTRKVLRRFLWQISFFWSVCLFVLMFDRNIFKNSLT